MSNETEIKALMQQADDYGVLMIRHLYTDTKLQAFKVDYLQAAEMLAATDLFTDKEINIAIVKEITRVAMVHFLFPNLNDEERMSLVRLHRFLGATGDAISCNRKTAGNEIDDLEQITNESERLFMQYQKDARDNVNGKLMRVISLLDGTYCNVSDGIAWVFLHDACHALL